MRVSGIIAEYNPFHSGHAYLLSKARRQSDAVVVAMSGNFTQRAEPALLSDRYRAEMALRNGADLILQLPLPYALSSAQNFARGGVSLLSHTGLVNSLVFGSECGDTAAIMNAAKTLLLKETDAKIVEYLEQGISYPAARCKAVENLHGGEIAALLNSPNDILGVEYVRAIVEGAHAMQPVAIRRRGTAHDAKTFTEGFASASLLREKIRNKEDVSAFMPTSACEILKEALKQGFAPSDYSRLEIAILSFLRTASPMDFQGVPDASEGLPNRILAAAQTATSLEELFTLAKTKRYTHARIRRVILCAFLGLQKSMTEGDVPYIRVLGANKTGIELLRQMEQTADLPILKRASDANVLTGRAKKLITAEQHATDLYNLTLPKIRPCGTELRDSMVILQDF